MPSGLTCIIADKDDVTFREYALRCARHMGACIHQRDEDMDAPPRPPRCEQQDIAHHRKCIADEAAKPRRISAREWIEQLYASLGDA